MKDAIKLVENMIDNNSMQMKHLALDYIRGERGNVDIKLEFNKLEQRNIALNEALEVLYEASEV